MSQNISVPPLKNFQDQLVGGTVTPVRVVLQLSRLGDYFGHRHFLSEKELTLLKKAVDAFNTNAIFVRAQASQKIQVSRSTARIADDLIKRCQRKIVLPLGERPPWPDSLEPI